MSARALGGGQRSLRWRSSHSSMALAKSASCSASRSARSRSKQSTYADEPGLRPRFAHEAFASCVVLAHPKSATERAAATTWTANRTP